MESHVKRHQTSLRGSYLLRHRISILIYPKYEVQEKKEPGLELGKGVK